MLFDVNKRYIFDKDVAFSNSPVLEESYYSDNSDSWVDLCNGREVKVLSEYEGIIKHDYAQRFIIDPLWCKELEE